MQEYSVCPNVKIPIANYEHVTFLRCGFGLEKSSYGLQNPKANRQRWTDAPVPFVADLRALAQRSRRFWSWITAWPSSASRSNRLRLHLSKQLQHLPCSARQEFSVVIFFFFFLSKTEATNSTNDRKSFHTKRATR